MWQPQQQRVTSVVDEQRNARIAPGGMQRQQYRASRISRAVARIFIARARSVPVSSTRLSGIMAYRIWRYGSNAA